MIWDFSAGALLSNQIYQVCMLTICAVIFVHDSFFGLFSVKREVKTFKFELRVNTFMYFVMPDAAQCYMCTKATCSTDFRKLMTR